MHDLDDLGEFRQRQLAFYSRFIDGEWVEVERRQQSELEAVKRRQREEWEGVRRRWGVRLLEEEEESEEEREEGEGGGRGRRERMMRGYEERKWRERESSDEV